MIEQNKKIRIAFFLPSLEGGGTERNVVNLLRNFNKNDYDLFLVLGEKKGVFLKEISQDIPIIDFNANNSLIVFLKLIKYFKKEKPDFFISAFPRFNVITMVAKIFSKTQTKIILTEQAAFSFFPIYAKTFFRKLLARFILPFLMKILYPRADGIICVSQQVAKELISITGPLPRIKIIHNPVVEQRIYHLAQESINHPWFQNHQIPIILSVGSLVKIKDFPTLLFAFNLILKKKQARLIILGQGKEEKKLKKLSQKLGLAENTAFLGFQENPYKYMKRSSIFVLCSRLEGFSNVLVEAMACDLPTVSTDCGGPSEIIRDKKNGILVSVGDEKSLAEAILKILNNPFLKKELSKEGKKRAQDFLAEEKTKEYEQFISELWR